MEHPTDRAGAAADPATVEIRTPERVDAHGGIYYPGDEESSRAPGAALVLPVLSLVAGGLYGWLFWPQKSSFDWVSALTLKTPELAVVGGLIMWCGGVLFIRHGLIWAARVGSIVAAVPMTRQLVDSLDGAGTVAPGPAGLSFLLGGGPALLVLALSFSPALNRWRHRRRETVAAEAAQRREKRARLARAAGTSLN
ncbi:MAG: hypothetical protein ABJA16_13215 [Nakamurella sp.]